MIHRERHSWRRLVALGGGLLISGCASFHSDSKDGPNPFVFADLPPVQSIPEGVSGPRTLGSAPSAGSFNTGIQQTSAEVAADDDDDAPITLRKPGTSDRRVQPSSYVVEKPIDRDVVQVKGGLLHGGAGCGIGGKCRIGGGGHTSGKAALEASGANLSSKPRLKRGDMGNNPMTPRELRMVQHPLYVVEPPDVLYVEALELMPNRPIQGERLVRQDGTISLGYYGQISVAGLTLPEIEKKLRDLLNQYVNAPEVYVDVASFNSKVFYVLGQVQQVGRLPITGKETVLDGIVLAGGLTNYANPNRIFLARPAPGGGCDQVYHIDWKAISQCGDTRTNYQLLPGDRIYVDPTKGYKALVVMDNYLTPVERVTNLFALFRFAFQSNNRN